MGGVGGCGERSMRGQFRATDSHGALLQWKGVTLRVETLTHTNKELVGQ